MLIILEHIKLNKKIIVNIIISQELIIRNTFICSISFIKILKKEHNVNYRVVNLQFAVCMKVLINQLNFIMTYLKILKICEH